VNSYQETLYRHLESYKASRLGVDKPGLFRHKGVDIEYGHILPVELKWLNLLEPFRAEIKAYLDAHPCVRLAKRGLADHDLERRSSMILMSV